MRIFIVKKDLYLADFSMKFSINAMAYTDEADAEAYLGRYLDRKARKGYEVNDLNGFWQVKHEADDGEFVITYIESLEVFDV